jgi:lauroyl/myristoyl acyltransferase
VDLGLIRYYAYRFLGAVMPRIPPRLGYALFSRIGQLAYATSSTARANVHDNLHHVLGHQVNPVRIEEVARQVFQNQARNYFDLFRVAALSADQLRRLVTLNGLEDIDQALSAGKGLIVAAAHLGSPDIVMQRFALQGYPMLGIAEHLQPERLYQYVASVRASKGMRVIPTDSFLRPLFRALRNNEILGLAVDRIEAKTGTLIEFFGAPALLPDWHVRLALRTGAKLVPAFSLRHPDNTVDAFVEPALELDGTGDAERDLRDGMSKLVAVLEKWIGQHPEQWVMFQPVWKLPDDLAEV